MSKYRGLFHEYLEMSKYRGLFHEYLELSQYLMTCLVWQSLTCLVKTVGQSIKMCQMLHVICN